MPTGVIAWGPDRGDRKTRAASIRIGSSSRDEPDGVLGTRRDALAAGLAGGRTRRVRGVASVRHALELAEQPEPREIAILDPPDLEHVHRADPKALGLALASSAIDDGHELAGRRFARGVRQRNTHPWGASFAQRLVSRVFSDP